jgi:hypothetical protein
VALADAGALADPVVGGVEPAGELLVGDDARREVGADTPHHGTQHGPLLL